MTCTYVAIYRGPSLYMNVYIMSCTFRVYTTHFEIETNDRRIPEVISFRNIAAVWYVVRCGRQAATFGQLLYNTERAGLVSKKQFVSGLQLRFPLVPIGTLYSELHKRCC